MKSDLYGAFSRTLKEALHEISHFHLHIHSHTDDCSHSYNLIDVATRL